MFSKATHNLTKHVNAKISANNVAVEDVDFPKNPFDDSQPKYSPVCAVIFT
jgi:hypothetical protein